MSLTLFQFLALYLWFPLAALLGFLLLIARFYEKYSGERTYFRLFLLPVVFSGAAAVRYASIESSSGDLLADTTFGVSGAVLLFLSLRLYRLMVRGRV